MGRLGSGAEVDEYAGADIGSGRLISQVWRVTGYCEDISNL
jgi:hypothetical protein